MYSITLLVNFLLLISNVFCLSLNYSDTFTELLLAKENCPLNLNASLITSYGIEKIYILEEHVETENNDRNVLSYFMEFSVYITCTGSETKAKTKEGYSSCPDEIRLCKSCFQVNATNAINDDVTSCQKTTNIFPYGKFRDCTLNATEKPIKEVTIDKILEPVNEINLDKTVKPKTESDAGDNTEKNKFDFLFRTPEENKYEENDKASASDKSLNSEFNHAASLIKPEDIKDNKKSMGCNQKNRQIGEIDLKDPVTKPVKKQKKKLDEITKATKATKATTTKIEDENAIDDALLQLAQCGVQAINKQNSNNKLDKVVNVTNSNKKVMHGVFYSLEIVVLSTSDSSDLTDPSGILADSFDQIKCLIELMVHPWLSSEPQLTNYKCNPMNDDTNKNDSDTKARKVIPNNTPQKDTPKKEVQDDYINNQCILDPYEIDSQSCKDVGKDDNLMVQVDIMAEYTMIELDEIDVDNYRRVVIDISNVKRYITISEKVPNGYIYTMYIDSISTACAETTELSVKLQTYFELSTTLTCVTQHMSVVKTCEVSVYVIGDSSNFVVLKSNCYPKK